MKKKVLATLLASSMIIGMLAGCGAKEETSAPAADTKTEEKAEEKAEEPAATGEKTVIRMLTILGNPTRDELTQKIVAEHTDGSIELEIISPPADQSRQKMITMLQAQEDIDIVELGNITMVDYINNNWIAPLDDYIAEWEDYATLQQTLKDQAVSYDGHFYGVANGLYQKALFYRKDWLEEAGLSVPTTMEEFYDVALALTDPANNRYGYSYRAGSGGAGFLDNHVRSDLGSKYITTAMPNVTNERKNIWEYPEAVAAAQYWVDLFQNCSNPDAVAWGYPETVESFYSGTAAMLIQDPEVIATCAEYMEDGTWDVAPLPVGLSGESWNNAGSGAWGITSYSEKKDAAWAVIAALSGVEGNNEWCKVNGNLPIHTTAAEDPYFGEGYYAAYSVMANKPDAHKWYADANETLWMTKEELDQRNSNTENDLKFQELVLGAISPEEYCEWRAQFDAWCHDSEWVKEVYPD